MNETSFFFGCVFVLLLYLGLIARYRTALFGLNSLNIFVVASASLSGLFVSVVGGESLSWVSEGHVEVFKYSLLGLIAMIAGVFLAWRPILRLERQALRGGDSVLRAPHLNQHMGWVTFLVGISFELVYPIVREVPTISTAIVSLSTLSRIGLLILLCHAIRTSEWRRFVLAVAIFGAISILLSLMSGFSFIRINTLIPLVLVALFFRGIRKHSLIAIPIVLAVFAVGISAWLSTRDVIRSGSLQLLSPSERVEQFFGVYVPSVLDMNWDGVYTAVFDRADMSMILAAQVHYQPESEPYAYGETVLSSFFTLIPRAVWSEKPNVAGGSAFVSRFTGMFRPSIDETSVGLPYQFELYANGGAWFVVLGLGLIGFLGGWMERRMLEGAASLGGFWALSAATALLCEGGQRTDVVLPTIIAAIICCYALGWVMERFWPALVSRLMTGGADFASSKRTEVSGQTRHKAHARRMELLE